MGTDIDFRNSNLRKLENWQAQRIRDKPPSKPAWLIPKSKALKFAKRKGSCAAQRAEKKAMAEIQGPEQDLDDQKSDYFRDRQEISSRIWTGRQWLE
jgi:hypothetical protein